MSLLHISAPGNRSFNGHSVRVVVGSTHCGVVGISQIVHVDLVLLLCNFASLVDIWLETLAEVAQTLEANADGQNESSDREHREHSQRFRSWGVRETAVALHPDSDELEEEISQTDKVENLCMGQSKSRNPTSADLPTQPIAGVGSLF